MTKQGFIRAEMRAIPRIIGSISREEEISGYSAVTTDAARKCAMAQIDARSWKPPVAPSSASGGSASAQRMTIQPRTASFVQRLANWPDNRGLAIGMSCRADVTPPLCTYSGGGSNKRLEKCSAKSFFLPLAAAIRFRQHHLGKLAKNFGEQWLTTSDLLVCEREPIGAFAWVIGSCGYCTGIYGETARLFGVGARVLESLIDDPDQAPVGTKPALPEFVRKLRVSGHRIERSDADSVLAAGWSEDALHDALAVRE